MTIEEVIEKIKSTIPDAQVEINGEDCNLSVIVSSAEFAGKTPIQCHRMVNEAVKEDIMSGRLHALSIKTKAL